VVGFDVDVEIDGSQGLPGIPSRRGGRMKPSGVSLWSQEVVGPITYSTAPDGWVMPLPGPHEVGAVTPPAGRRLVCGEEVCLPVA
jgi:hypothetical protein